MAITQTFPAKIYRSLRPHQAGFTLIEIMIVLAIIGAALSIAAPRLFKTNNNIKSVARTFLVLGKEIRNHARLTNSTMRLVLDLDPAAPKYWIEKANGPRMIDNDPEEAAKLAEKNKDDDKKKPDEWQPYTLLMKKKKELPSDLFFGPVETIHMKAPATEGLVYIHFFPEGLMEAASVQITNRKGVTWTMLYNPLTGHADIIEEARSLKDVSR